MPATNGRPLKGSGQHNNGRSNGKPQQNGEQTDSLDRQPPFDLQAEQGVLGSAILLFDVLDEIVQILSAEDFYDDAHQKMFRHLVAMHEHGRRFDLTLLTARLKEANEYEAVGGAQYLGKVINAVPNAAHAIHYAEIVKGHSTARRLIVACTETLQEAYDATGQQNELVAQAESRIARVSDATIQGRDTRGMSEVVMESLLALNDRFTTGGTRLLRVGLDAFAHCMGLVPGGVTIIGGRTSQGKTACAVTVGSYVARHDGVVYFASLEMTALELADRMLAQAAQVEYSRMVSGRISNEDRAAIVDVAGTASNWPLFLDDRPSMTVSQIGAAARRLKRRRGRLDLLIVDYLQLVEPESRRDDRVEQLAKISRGLKRMARELEVPVLALAQVNRQAVEGGDKRPQLHHLRGCGDLEQDADTVVFTHRPAFYDPALRPAVGNAENAEIIVAKNRNGPTQTYEALWWGGWMTWANKAPERHEQFDHYNAAQERDCGEQEFR